MADWVRTQGDQVHSVFAQLTDQNGPLNIPAGTVVTFEGRLLGTEFSSIGGTGVVLSPDAPPEDPDLGRVRYDLSTSDVAVPGIYYCKWKLVPPSSTQVQSFPEDGSMTLVLVPVA